MTAFRPIAWYFDRYKINYIRHGQVQNSDWVNAEKANDAQMTLWAVSTQTLRFRKSALFVKLNDGAVPLPPKKRALMRRVMLRVLIADDEQVIADSLAEILARYGYPTTAA